MLALKYIRILPMNSLGTRLSPQPTKLATAVSNAVCSPGLHSYMPEVTTAHLPLNNTVFINKEYLA